MNDYLNPAAEYLLSFRCKFILSEVEGLRSGFCSLLSKNSLDHTRHIRNTKVNMTT